MHYAGYTFQIDILSNYLLGCKMNGYRRVVKSWVELSGFVFGCFVMVTSIVGWSCSRQMSRPLDTWFSTSLLYDKAHLLPFWCARHTSVLSKHVPMSCVSQSTIRVSSVWVSGTLPLKMRAMLSLPRPLERPLALPSTHSQDIYLPQCTLSHTCTHNHPKPLHSPPRWCAHTQLG